MKDTAKRDVRDWLIVFAVIIGLYLLVVAHRSFPPAPPEEVGAYEQIP